ncbi:MAG: hypothetical protein DMG06_30410 [Acidobacteria bacterium]|nr:MAG: hypothetical protein DMG06_30410 [Acidobacteriota bacterium]
MLSDLGVRKLAAAVVMTAIKDSFSKSPSRQDPARDWILNDQTMFPFWCRVSDISPERVKRTMMQRFKPERQQVRADQRKKRASEI